MSYVLSANKEEATKPSSVTLLKQISSSIADNMV